jgi:hypothetical protein
MPGVTVDAARRESVRRAKPCDVANLDRIVREDLGLDYSPWLAPTLLYDFGAAFVGFEGITITPEDVGLPAGRRPKDDGLYIARDVEWLYRAEIQRPPESKRTLGRRYLATLQGARGSDGRATVQAGIDRAKHLLAIFLDDPPLPK